MPSIVVSGIENNKLFFCSCSCPLQVFATVCLGFFYVPYSLGLACVLLCLNYILCILTVFILGLS